MEEDNNSTYKFVNYSGKENKGSGMKKNIVVPFISGVLGASLVVGVCFGVPNVKDKLLGTSANNKATLSTSSLPTVQQSNSIDLMSYSDVGSYAASKILPSIVGITVEYSVSSIFGQSGTASATGSGIIISEDGYIVTNNHVVSTSSSTGFYRMSDASKITVKLYKDDAEYEAKIIGTDPTTDIAVIKIEKTGLTAAEMGNSDTLQLGEFAMVAGNPLGFDFSVTSGSISALNRELTDSNTGVKYTLIQTDAAINSGNSGGALVNAKGQVIGISTAKISSTDVEGICFAIPITPSLDIINQLIENKRVIRPYIGVGGEDIDARTAERYGLVEGLYIQEIDSLSNAAHSGLQVRDIIISIDGHTVKTMDDLDSYKNTKKIGDVVTIKVNRNGEELEFQVELMATPAK